MDNWEDYDWPCFTNFYMVIYIYFISIGELYVEWKVKIVQEIDKYIYCMSKWLFLLLKLYVDI